MTITNRDVHEAFDRLTELAFAQGVQDADDWELVQGLADGSSRTRSWRIMRGDRLILMLGPNRYIAYDRIQLFSYGMTWGATARLPDVPAPDLSPEAENGD